MRSPMLACCLLLTLTACAKEPHFEPLVRQLPAEPSFAKPVLLPVPKAGEKAGVVILRERRGRQRANVVITCTVDWYRGVAASYAGDAGKSFVPRQDCVGLPR
jgi:hypothetical protein